MNNNTPQYEYTIKQTWQNGTSTDRRLGIMSTEDAARRVHDLAIAFVRSLYPDCKDAVGFSSFRSSGNIVFYVDGREVCTWEVITVRAIRVGE